MEVRGRKRGAEGQKGGGGGRVDSGTEREEGGQKCKLRIIPQAESSRVIVLLKFCLQSYS